jgi:hypothetical protein
MEIGENDEVTWQSDLNGRDASKLKNGNYLVVQGTKVDEVTPDNAVVWTYHVDDSNKELMGAHSHGLTVESFGHHFVYFISADPCKTYEAASE